MERALHLLFRPDRCEMSFGGDKLCVVAKLFEEDVEKTQVAGRWTNGLRCQDVDEPFLGACANLVREEVSVSVLFQASSNVWWLLSGQSHVSAAL